MTAKSGLLMEDVYQELHLRGYNYGPTFQGVLECNSEGEDTFCRRKIEHDYCVVRNICFFFYSVCINHPPNYASWSNYVLSVIMENN